MKSYKRYLSVFVVCLLLFAIFSINVSAELVDDITAQVTIGTTGGYIHAESFFDKNSEYTTALANIERNWGGNGPSIYYYITLKKTGGGYLIEKDKSYKFALNNIIANHQYGKTYESVDWRSLYALSMMVYYSDGSTETITTNLTYSFNSNSSLGAVNVTGYLTAKNNITGLRIELRYNPLVQDGVSYTDNVVLAYGFDPLDFDLSLQSEETGLLSGITGWIQNIFNKITDTFNEIKSGFSNVVNGLIELPSKLWDLISEGLKNLFVPAEEYMSNFSDKWDELLSQRFGAIYQVGTIINDFVDRIQMTDKTNTIHMPVVSLDSVGIPFSFGGYDVQIVPNGFDTVVEICKKIISIVCTFLFINGLRKKYDEVMGVKE